MEASWACGLAHGGGWQPHPGGSDGKEKQAEALGLRASPGEGRTAVREGALFLHEDLIARASDGKNQEPGSRDGCNP